MLDLANLIKGNGRLDPKMSSMWPAILSTSLEKVNQEIHKEHPRTPPPPLNAAENKIDFKTCASVIKVSISSI